MQTPTGFAVDPATGNFYATNWIEVIFNPSLPTRLGHMLLAAYITTAAVVLAAGAWQVIRGRLTEPTRWQMRMAAGTLTLLLPIQILVGHQSGEIAHEYQPAKIAVAEGWCESAPVQGTMLIAWPSDTECGHSGITIPGTSPYLFASAPKGEDLKGLDAFAREDRPPLWLVFYSFRIMVGAGLGMLGLGVWGCVLWWRKRLDHPGLFHWLAVPGGMLGFIAVITGWIVAEVGRQPYTVYGALRTVDSVSPISAGQVATSLLVFMVTYAIIFTAGTVYMARIATRGFDDDPPGQKDRRAPGSPLGAVDDPAETSDDIVAVE
jgi:cytochrome d ubiquinol oxidase subunit I